MTAVYLLRSDASGRYYIGSGQDPYDRLDQHNSGTTKSTRGRGPMEADVRRMAQQLERGSRKGITIKIVEESGLS